MKRIARTLATLSVLAMLAGGIFTTPAPAQDSPEPPGEDKKLTFTVGLESDMVSANPFKACCGSEYEMMFLAYDMLYNFGQTDLLPVSGLAEYPPQRSEDGKTWTFKIREGVKWSDGKPLTAADIAFTYNFIWKKKLAAFNDYLGDPAGFEAPDATTLIWKMNTPSLSPLTPPWVPILPEHIWSRFWKADTRTIKEFRNVPAVGSGPFVLEEWQEGRFWRMTANKNYWGGAPVIDEVIFRLYDNQEAMKLALQEGEIDFAEALTPPIFNDLKLDPTIQTHVASQSYFDDLAFNFEGSANPVLRDEHVRDAIHHAIDKQAIVDRVMLGNGTPGDSVILPTYTKWYREFNGTPDEIAYDPQEAKQILDEAGYRDTDGDGIREDKNGKPIELEVLTISDVTYSVQEGKLIEGWLDDIGFDAKTKTVSETKAYDLWGAQNFDMYVWGWGNDPDPDFTLSIFTTKQCLVWSDGCYKDPAYDKMYEEQHTQIDEQKRIQMVNEMQKYLYDKAPLIVLAYESDLQAWRKDRWTGFVNQPEPNGSVLFTFGPYSYINLRPVTSGAVDGGEGASDTAGGGIPAGIWIAIAVGVVIVIVAVAVARRGKSDEDVE